MKITILSKVIQTENGHSILNGGMTYNSQEIIKISANKEFQINETILANCKILKISNKTLFVEVEKFKVL